MSEVVRSKCVMPSLVRKRCSFLLCGGLVLAFASELLGQNAEPQGGEYSLSGAVIGDQTNPQIAISASGGYIVWQDNAIDGDNLGIAARRLSASLSPSLGAFRVNKTVAGWQENPSVALMRNGAAAIVWQGGKQGSQNIYLRVLGTNGTFSTDTDVQVNKYTKGEQIRPVIACITNGNLAVAWSSSRQDGSHQGIYARVIHRNGSFVTEPFQVNQFTSNNQRNPSIGALSNGTFVVVWASENQGLSVSDVIRFTNRVHIYGRVFTKGGLALGNEFRINTRSNLCAMPSVTAYGSEGFTVAWAEQSDIRTNGWDIYARHFQLSGDSSTEPFRVNTTTYGDQFSPRISCVGDQQLVVWTSLARDGSYEGVCGQLLTQGQLNATDFQVNTIWRQAQMHPAVGADGNNRFLVGWSSYTGTAGHNIRAQRYSVGQPPLPAPDPPLISALSQSSLGVIWSELSGLPVQHYELFIDEGEIPVLLNAPQYVANGLLPGSTHSFQLAFVLTDGRRSERSASTAGKTWGADLTGAASGPDGLPDDWQMLYWGSKPSGWSAAAGDNDGDGATNYQEFLAGTDPTDPRSVLKTSFSQGDLGRYLNWNTRPGSIYQVQISTNFVLWDNVGSARRAAGSSDSVLLGSAAGTAFYRVVRVQ
jgi:hypothetical protein